MSDWSIRLARLDDAEHLPAIEHAATEVFRSDPDLGDLDFDEVWTAEEHRTFIARGHSLVAVIGERVVGFLASEPCGRELHIHEMDVHPRNQQQGIGARLLRGCIIDARNAGFTALTLTTFRDLNWNGPFYEQLGFVEVTDLASQKRLAEILEEEVREGLPRDRRIAMIRFLN